jgi:DNA-binding Lrp family transcriptional regulator
MFAMDPEEHRSRGPKLPPGEMRERVRTLLAAGVSKNEIARRLGVSKGTVNYHTRRLNVPIDTRFGKRYDWEEIRIAYEGGLSRLECVEKFGFSADAWMKAVKRGAIVPRPVAMPIEDLLVVGRKTSRHHLKVRLLKEGLKTNRCEQCGIATWRGKPLNVQLHHKNGDGTDNRIENLELLSPNCHSQTDTYGGRNGHRRPDRHLRLIEPPPDEDPESDEEVA